MRFFFISFSIPVLLQCAIVSLTVNSTPLPSHKGQVGVMERAPILTIEDSNPVQNLPPLAFQQEIKKLSNSKIQILDVRSLPEFQEGALPNALQANWQNKTEFEERTAFLQKNQPTFVYCLSGVRSAQAAKWLQSKGFTKIYQLDGGLINWKKQGLPLENNSKAKSQQPISAAQYAIQQHPTLLVKVGADWCPPCKQQEPILNSFLQKNNQVKLFAVDAGTDTDLMKWLEVEKIPSLLLYKNGKILWKKSGVASLEELQNALKN